MNSKPKKPRSGKQERLFQKRRHLQFRIKVTKLLVDLYVTVPALQFGHSPLVFIAISLVDTVKGCLRDFFIFWDNMGARPARERHPRVLDSSEPRAESSRTGDGETISRPPPLPCQGHSHYSHTRQPCVCQGGSWPFMLRALAAKQSLGVPVLIYGGISGSSRKHSPKQ